MIRNSRGQLEEKVWKMWRYVWFSAIDKLFIVGKAKNVAETLNKLML